MANELKVGASLLFDKGDSYVPFGKQGLELDVSGDQYIRNKQTVGTAEEAMVLGDVAAGGYLIGYNGHASATISIRAASGLQDTVDVGPGELCIFRTHVGSTPYLISSVAGADFEYVLVDA